MSNRVRQHPAVSSLLGIPASLRAPLQIIRGGGTLKPANPQLARRGVREADYLIDGCRVLEAIDSRGNCVKRARILPGINEEIPREWLAGYLEHVDAQLRVHPSKVPAHHSA